MGKIHPYEQGQLASVAVGTPGVDTSGAELFQAVGKAAAGVQEEVVAAARQNQYLLAQAQREQKARAKEHREALDAAEVAKHTYNIDRVLDLRRVKTEQEHPDDPTAGVAAYDVGGRQDIDEYIKTVNPELQPKVTKAAYGSLQASMGRVTDWESRQRTANTMSDAKRVLEEHAIDLGNASTPEELFAKSKQFDEKYGQTYRSVLGKAQFDEMYRDAKEKGVVNQLARLVDSNPKLAEQIVSDKDPDKDNPYRGVYSDVVDQEKVKEIFRDLRSEARRKQADDETKDRLAQQGEKVGFYSRLYDLSDGNPANLTTQQAIQLQQEFPNVPVQERIVAQRNIAQAKQRELDAKDDRQLVREFAAQVPGINKLADEISLQQKKVYAATGEARKREAQKLDTMVDAYKDRAADMKQFAATVKDKDAQAMLKSEVEKIRDVDADVSKTLTGFKRTISENDAAQAKFRQAVGAPPKKFGNDPRRSSVYTYYYNLFVRNEFRLLFDKNALDKATGSKKYMDGFRKEADTYATTAAMKINPTRRRD